MILSDYWSALSSRQRAGVAAGLVLIVAAAGASVWLLVRDPYVTLAAGLAPDRLNELSRELERANIPHRVGASADALDVPTSQLGKARVAAAGGSFAVPPSVGLELFNETDFSTTDFAQRVNYQRALQGELTRTIQTIAGVRSARVHIALAEGGLFKRDAARASAAVTISQEPGMQLTATQVRGIQRLVAATVPQMQISDVVVLDQSGASLTRGEVATDELSAAQLDAKREADRYLESKLLRLLQDVAPTATASVSVDTVLDDRQVNVTTDEPLAVRAQNGARPAGVLVKERQLQRGGASPYVDVDTSVSDSGSTEWEHEYAVGRRTEQSTSRPGSIKRVSVAVALQGAPAQMSTATLEQLIRDAVGLDPSRGDSVTVMLLEDQEKSVGGDVAVETEQAHPRGMQPGEPIAAALADRSRAIWIAAVFAVLLVIAWLAFELRFGSARRERVKESAVDVDAVAAKVRRWLAEEGGNGSG